MSVLTHSPTPRGARSKQDAPVPTAQVSTSAPHTQSIPGWRPDPSRTPLFMVTPCAMNWVLSVSFAAIKGCVSQYFYTCDILCSAWFNSACGHTVLLHNCGTDEITLWWVTAWFNPDMRRVSRGSPQENLGFSPNILIISLDEYVEHMFTTSIKDIKLPWILNMLMTVPTPPFFFTQKVISTR